MRVDERGCQKVSLVLGAGVFIRIGMPGVVKTSQLSEVSLPFVDDGIILYVPFFIKNQPVIKVKTQSL
jgi:hypothetical protein